LELFTLPVLLILQQVAAESIPTATSPLLTTITSKIVSTTIYTVGSTTSETDLGDVYTVTTTFTGTSSNGLVYTTVETIGEGVVVATSVTIPILSTQTYTTESMIVVTTGYVTLYGTVSDQSVSISILNWI